MKNKDIITHHHPWEGWKRLQNACEITGLKRSWFYEHMKKGAFRSAVLKDEGKPRGIRMIHMPSLREYIESNLVEDYKNKS